MSNTTMEEVFKAGWQAYEDYLHDGLKPETVDEAWEQYRYDQLLKVTGKEVADEWLHARRHPSQSKIENLKCPDCGGEMVPRSGAYGKFWGCKRYPSCKGTRDSNGMSKIERAAERNKYASIDQPMPEPEDVPVESGELYKFKKS